MSARLLVDTNVWLDVLLDREPHADDSADALSLAQNRGATLVLGATTVTTLFYFIEKFADSDRASAAVRRLLDHHEIANVTGDVLRTAVDARIGDFEDAVLHEVARRANVGLILTRNAADFEAGQLDVSTPREYVSG